MKTNINPVFVKITENTQTPDIPHDIVANQIELPVGNEVNIGGNVYAVSPLKDAEGNFLIKDSKDDLRMNLRAYEELQRSEVIREFPIDDLCLRNKRNGNVLIEIQVPEKFYRKVIFNPVFETKQKNFFVRLDSSMLNTRLKEENIAFEEVEIKMTPCMFAANSAVAIGESGKQMSITERSTIIDEPVKSIYTYPKFTFYEREIVSRLVGAVNILSFNQKIDKVTTVLPHGAYYSFLFQAASQGLVSPSLVLDWFDKVDKRVKYLKLLIKEGIHQYSPHIEINQYSFMDIACGVMRSYFKERVANPTLQVDLNELFDLVLNHIIAHDTFAQQVFASGIEKPKDFRSLADFTYAICNLTDMELKEGVIPKPKLIIGVFDVSEVIAWNVMKKIRNGGLLAFRGQFDAKNSKNTTYDHLSYINVMPIEHIIFDVSPEFVEQYMGGSLRLYSARLQSLHEHEEVEKNIIQPSLGLENTPE